MRDVTTIAGGRAPRPSLDLLLSLARYGRLAVSRSRRRGAAYSERAFPVRWGAATIFTFNLDTFAFLAREIFLRRVYEVGNLPPAPVIVDCGANIGVAALFFTLRHPACRILAIEPDPSAFAALETTSSANSWDHVALLNVALGGSDGEATLYRDPSKPGKLTVTTAAPPAPDFLPTTVPRRRLSAVLPEGEIDLLKVDVEGAETAIVDELADAAMLNRIRNLVIEVHGVDALRRADAIAQRLTAADFHFALKPQTIGEVLLYARRATIPTQ